VAGPVIAGTTPLSDWLSGPLVVGEPAWRADANVVFGAGAYDTTAPAPDTAYRLVRGIQLWRQGYAPVLILSGGGIGKCSVTEAETMR
jgi:hypothetical protein